MNVRNRSWLRCFLEIPSCFRKGRQFERCRFEKQPTLLQEIVYETRLHFRAVPFRDKSLFSVAFYREIVVLRLGLWLIIFVVPQLFSHVYSDIPSFRCI